MSNEPKLAANEGIKTRSNYLRGSITEGLNDRSTGGMCEDDQQLLKFHGTYQQDDRDIRAGRRKNKLEKAYSFMIRIRVPGGVTTPAQWLECDRMASEYANETIKLTTRQAYQFHGIIKSNLKRTIKEINDTTMDTIAACGDVNRNVMCNPAPTSPVHEEVLELSRAINTHLTPATRAYHEIWLDGEKVESSEEDIEPIYGKTYLPRKFKITIAVPPSNDVDIYANDLSFIAIVEDEKLVGYNVAVGGGMGMTHGVDETYPCVAHVIGFCKPEQAVDVAEKVVLVQRDHGNRVNRKRARFKYTIDDRGVDWVKAELNKYLGYDLEEARHFEFTHNGDRYGWLENNDETYHFGLFVQGGRVVDTEEYKLRTALREIAKVHDGDFRLTGNQNLVIARVSKANRPVIEKLISDYKLDDHLHRSALRLNSIACVSLPTCGLALAESERYLPSVITDLEEVLEKHGLRHDAITIRMTGCPNGCGRPFISEIGFVGKGPNRYNLYLGGGFWGQRLSKLWKVDVSGDDIKEVLSPVIEDYAKNRLEGEHFGDFTVRAGYVKATVNGPDFHLDTPKA